MDPSFIRPINSESDSESDSDSISSELLKSLNGSKLGGPSIYLSLFFSLVQPTGCKF